MTSRLFPQFLWDLLPKQKKVQAPPKASRPKASTKRQAMYDALVEEMKSTYQLRVRKWRSSTSGCAWEVHYHNGTVSRLIESPYPRGPMSCAVFLHEVGHHAIGLSRYRPRCLEEYHAWRWALEEMERRSISVTERVLTRRDDALRYAVAKALRRGLRRLPVELLQWAPPGVLGTDPQAKTSSSDPILV